MDINTFAQALKLEGKIIAVKRVNDLTGTAFKQGGCNLRELNRALAGETVVFTAEQLSCGGGKKGFGFVDGLPEIPGGFGHFLTKGAGEGYPPGERLKCSVPVAEGMIACQPEDVLAGYSAILAKPYEEGDEADLVLFLANPDQLSALVILFNYRKPEYDQVIMPMSSGCASVFRIPFGELTREQPRAVIASCDIFSRPHFPADTFWFVVPEKNFQEMLADATDSFLIAPIWRGVSKRIQGK